MYPRNAASPERIGIGPVVQISDGAVQTSGVSISVRGQGGASGAGAGTTAYDNGIVEYTPTQAETDFTSFVVVAYKTGCIPVSQTIITSASATAGYAGVDWSKITAPTTTLNLSGTTVKTVTDVEADTQDIQARLPAALVSGRIDASVGAMDSGVLTATAIAGDAITAAKIAAGAIDAATFAADVDAEIAGMVWNAATASFGGAGTYGQALEDVLDDTGTSGVVVAAGSKTGYTLTATTGLGNQTANITGSLSGSVGSVTGAVGSVTGNVGGNVTGSVGSVVGAVGSVTGNVGGNVVGSVGSVATGGITAASLAADAITAAKVAADVGTEIGTAVWATTTRQLTSAQTFDLTGSITGNLSGSVGSVTGAVGSVTGLTASDVAAIKAKTDSLTFTVAGHVDANIQRINDVAITGDGSGTPFNV